MQRQVGIYAMLAYAVCPVAFFCSQKVWIDNCLIMNTLICGIIHIYMCEHTNSSKSTTIYIYHFISGLIYGGIALNTKITALAMLPFMLVYSAFNRYMHYTHEFRNTPSNVQNNNSMMYIYTRDFIIDVCVHWSMFMCGLICGHGPWVYTYHVSNHIYMNT